jgi:hypothetical protein
VPARGGSGHEAPEDDSVAQAAIGNRPLWLELDVWGCERRPFLL